MTSSCDNLLGLRVLSVHPRDDLMNPHWIRTASKDKLRCVIGLNVLLEKNDDTIYLLINRLL